MTEISCRIRQNAKFVDGTWDLTAPQEAKISARDAVMVKENGVVVWCVHCSVSLQPIELRHLVIAPFRNTKKLLVVSMQSRFDTSRFDKNSSSEILGEYRRSLSQVRGTIYT